MAGRVSVDKSAVAAGIRCCDVSMEALRSAAVKLAGEYRDAGLNGWTDAKYRELGEIVRTCFEAMKGPVRDLEACKGKLQLLMQAIEQYEETRI